MTTVQKPTPHVQTPDNLPALVEEPAAKAQRLIAPPAWASEREVDLFPREVNITDTAKLHTGTQVHAQIERFSLYGIETGDVRIGPDQICIRWDSAEGFGHELQQVDVYMNDLPAVIAALTLGLRACVPGNTGDTAEPQLPVPGNQKLGFDPCSVYAWCQVDHSKDDDAIDAQYHKQSRSGGVIDYDLVMSEGRPYVYWQDNFSVTVDVENDVYFDQLIVDLVDMKTAWIEFERRLRARSVPGNGTSSDHVSEVTDHPVGFNKMVPDHVRDTAKMIRRRPEVDERLRELDA